MVISREWSMPSSHTFSIKPIKRLIEEELLSGVIVDPFSNNSAVKSIITDQQYVTNDLDEQYDTDYHMDALDFLRMFDTNSVDMVLYDPPYSPRQVSECYKALDKTVNSQTTQSSYWANQKKEIARITKNGGKVITFGWNSGGIGKSYGFEISRILLVAHGGWHNDTICTVERKG